MKIINSKAKVMSNMSYNQDFLFHQRINNSQRCLSRNSGTKRNQYDSIKQQQTESIIQWVTQTFKSLPNCAELDSIQGLYSGSCIAQILNQIFGQSTQELQALLEDLLDKMQISNMSRDICKMNLNEVLKTLCTIFNRLCHYIEYKNTSGNVLIETQIAQRTRKFLKQITSVQLIDKKFKMVKFMMEVVMILPEIQPLIVQSYKINLKNSQNPKLYHHNKKVNINAKSDIEQLSSIYDSVPLPKQSKDQCNQLKDEQIDNNNIHIKQTTTYRENNKTNKTQGSNVESNTNSDEYMIHNFEMEQKISKLVTWIKDTYSLPIQNLEEPHQFLGQVVNCILTGGNNRLQPKQLPIKPIHYDLGSFSVYQKVIKLLETVERFSKTNLIQIKKEIENDGQVQEQTYWSLIEDLWKMGTNKNISSNYSSKKSKSKGKIKASNQKQNENSRKTKITENNQNLNKMNNLNEKQAQLLLKQSKATTIKGVKKVLHHPNYDSSIIRQTQIWLSEQMGFGHSLSKSVPLSGINVLQNPLLNGTLFSKLLMRLKIGAAKGIVSSPMEAKHIKRNIQTIKNQYLKRGYQCIRKIDLFKPTYNFYIGLISQIRIILSSKKNDQNIDIMKDKTKKNQQRMIFNIAENQKKQLVKWVKQSFDFDLNERGAKQNKIYLTALDLKLLVQITLPEVKFLRETTQKIKQSNMEKLLEYFRFIGLSHYYEVKAEDLLKENPNKNSQQIKWTILSDLKLLKGQK